MTAGHEPLVSIVTPTLNQGMFIEQTIASLKRQSYRNFEHIVVDGGSTDETLEVLRRHEGTYNMRWLSEPDRGMYDAVNKGLRLATGQILAYLNSDDLYFPWTLDVVVDEFIRNPRADFAYGEALAIDDKTGRHEVYWMPPFNLGQLREFGFLAQAAVFWRRDVFETEGPFDESLRFVADCDYWMRVGANRRFHKVNEFLAIERQHDATLREATDGAVWAELERVRARYVSPKPDPAGRLRRFRLRSHIWFRIYWGIMVLQAMRPARFRSGPWSRLLNSGHPRISWPRVLLMLLPRIGDPQQERAIAPSRHWLQPADDLE